MKQRFVPFGSVSARPEFRAFAPDSHPARASALAAQVLDALAALVELFDLDDAVVYMAWELAQMPRKLKLSEQRAAFILVLCTIINTRQGSTCLPMKGGLELVLEALINDEVSAILGCTAADLHEQISRLLQQNKLSAIVGTRHEDDAYKPLIFDNGYVFHQRMLFYEDKLIDTLSERLVKQIASVQTDGISAHLEQVWRVTDTITLTNEQRYAVLTAVHTPMTIITGGPGTGKTSIVVSLLRLLARLGVRPSEFALAAPTGKAANRMLESIESQLRQLQDPHTLDTQLIDAIPKPQTIHRLLGYSGQLHQYHHQEYNPLDARVVIVDEASMIDLFLMERLIRAIRSDAHLVLLGDVDQLPSVEAGAVLRDLASREPSTMHPWRRFLEDPPPCHSGRGVGSQWTAQLTHSHRMRADDPAGRQILLAARAVRDADFDLLMSVGVEGSLSARQHADDILWEGAEWLEISGPSEHDHRSPAERLSSFVEHWFTHEIRPVQDLHPWRYKITSLEDDLVKNEDELAFVKTIFDRLQRARILALTRSYATGTEALNLAMIEQIEQEYGLRNLDGMLPGVPVMMRRNDYEREIFNGDQGVLLPAVTSEQEELMVFFPRGETFVAFGLESLQANLELCYAMTVHKSQGSEFERIAMILPPTPLPLMSREVLYTAITRSKKGALIVGSKQVLAAGVANRMQRFSRLEEALDALSKSSAMLDPFD